MEINTIKTWQYQITQFEKPIEISFSLFSNCLLVVITQIGRFGSIIHGECENWKEALTKEDYIYEIKTIFGSKEYEIYELYARKILEMLYDRDSFIQNLQSKYNLQLNQRQVGNPFFGKELKLFIALDPHSNEEQSVIMYKDVIKSINENLVNIF